MVEEEKVVEEKVVEEEGGGERVVEEERVEEERVVEEEQNLSNTFPRTRRGRLKVHARQKQPSVVVAPSSPNNSSIRRDINTRLIRMII